MKADTRFQKSEKVFLFLENIYPISVEITGNQVRKVKKNEAELRKLPKKKIQFVKWNRKRAPARCLNY